MAKVDPAFRHLLVALARTDLAGGFPEKLMFIWIEPQLTEGYAISKPVRRAIRRAVGRIFQELCKLDLATVADAPSVLRWVPAVASLR